jgi:hypothetical protein
VPVRLDWKSVALAYPRVWLWFLAFAWPFLTHWGENVNRIPSSTWLTCGGLIVLALLFHLPGRLSSREKDRLRVLGSVTGMRVDPSKLMPWTRTSKQELLEAELAMSGVDTTPEGIVAASAGAPREALAALYAFACYSGDDREWRDVAAQVLERHRAAA